MTTSKRKWRAVSLVEALNHARGREFVATPEYDPSYGISDEEIVTFTDGTAVKVEHLDGFDYSEYTQESGTTTFFISEPTP